MLVTYLVIRAFLMRDVRQTLFVFGCYVIDQHKVAAGRKNLFHLVVVWKKFLNDN